VPRRVSERNVTVKIVGVGSGGARVVDAVRVSGVPGASRILIDCDRTVLGSLRARRRVLVGRDFCGGLGTGGSKESAWHVAKKDMSAILSAVCPADAVFVIACMGKGFGSQAAQLICGEVRKTGSFVGLVAVQPFEFEGREVVSRAVEETRGAISSADTVIVLANSVGARTLGEKLALEQLLDKVNEHVAEAVRGLVCLLVRRQAMSIGLGEIRGKLSGCFAAMGCGKASGSRSILKAFTNAVTSSLLVPEDCETANSLLVSVASKKELQVEHLREACDFIAGRVGGERVFFGFTCDPELGRTVSVTVLAGSERFPCGWLSGGMRHLAASRPSAPRGMFAEMAPTLHNGEDLDVPTYIRHPELVKGRAELKSATRWG